MIRRRDGRNVADFASLSLSAECVSIFVFFELKTASSLSVRQEVFLLSHFKARGFTRIPSKVYLT